MKIIKINTEQAIPEPFNLLVSLLSYLLAKHYEKHGNLPAGFESPKGKYTKVLKSFNKQI